MSSRDTSSAPMRSRSAPSSAFSQPCSMWMRLHRPLQTVQPVLGQPGLQLAVGLDLFLQRLQRFQRADRSACLADSVLTCCCACGGLRRVAAPSPATHADGLRQLHWLPVHFFELLLQRDEARLVGCDVSALRSWSSRSRRFCNWRDCSSILRCSAASTWICCCTCITLPRWSLAALCAVLQRPLPVPSGNAWPALPPGRPAARFALRRAAASSARRSSSAWASSRRVAHWASCSFSDTRRCSTRRRPSTTKRISASSRPTSVLASYSRPWAWLTWSPAA